RHDADIQTAEQAPDRQARVPQAHGRPLGPGRPVAPPQEGAEAVDGFDRLEARPRLTGDERFGRSHRLPLTTDVRRVLTTARHSRRRTLDIHWTAGATGHSRMGLIVPRFRESAVARNRLRRRLKEVWRRDVVPLIPPFDVVIRTRKDAYGAPFDVL